MTPILVDSSVWISYFRDEETWPELDDLIRDNQVAVNELILAELLPVLLHRQHLEVVEALRSLILVPLQPRWEAVIGYQVRNLKAGLNGVGIPDLLILDQVLSEGMILMSGDRHFMKMKEFWDFPLYAAG